MHILIKISLKFVICPINNKAALVQVFVWFSHSTSQYLKPNLTQIYDCQWLQYDYIGYMDYMDLDVWCPTKALITRNLFGAKPLSKPMITSHWLHPKDFSEQVFKTKQFLLMKLHLKVIVCNFEVILSSTRVNCHFHYWSIMVVQYQSHHSLALGPRWPGPCRRELLVAGRCGYNLKLLSNF